MKNLSLPTPALLGHARALGRQEQWAAELGEDARLPFFFDKLFVEHSYGEPEPHFEKMPKNKAETRRAVPFPTHAPQREYSQVCLFRLEKQVAGACDIETQGSRMLSR